MTSGQSFAVPSFVSAEFAAIRGYWNSLKRGGATIPFSDDFKPGALGRLSEMTVVLNVFEKPQRFRFSLSGKKVAHWYGAELDDRFADELNPRAPLDSFMRQASATVELGAPTFYRHETERGPAYQRLMLPFWGEGHDSAILAAFEPLVSGAAT